MIRVDNPGLGQHCYYCGFAYPRMYSDDKGMIVCRPGPECRVPPSSHRRRKAGKPGVTFIPAIRELTNLAQRPAKLMCSRINGHDLYFSISQENDIKYNFRLNPEQAAALRDWLDEQGLPRKEV